MSESFFLDQRGDFRSLKAYKKAECIYDVTYYFAHKYLERGDRTIDQMVQAARSGKQNLAEGYVDAVSSKEMGIKLVNVNRASLQELLLDYEDFLRVRSLTQWPAGDPRLEQTRRFCRTHLDAATYRKAIAVRSAETIANIAITLIHQEDALLRGFIEWMKGEFLKNGGIKEEMYRARMQWRSKNGYYGGNGASGNYGLNGVNGVNGANGVNGLNGVNGDSQKDPTNPR